MLHSKCLCLGQPAITVVYVYGSGAQAVAEELQYCTCKAGIFCAGIATTCHTQASGKADK